MPKFEVKVSDRNSDWREATAGTPAAMNSMTDSTTGPESVEAFGCQLCIPDVERGVPATKRS